MIIIAQEDVGLDTRSLPVQVEFYPIEKIEEKILYYIIKNMKVLGLYSGAWSTYTDLIQRIELQGVNPYAYFPVDPLEFELAQPALTAADLLLSKLLMIMMTKLDRVPKSYTLSKRVSRRDLITNPIKSITKYYSAPYITMEDRCVAHPNCNLCIESCPKEALRGKPPKVNPVLCDSCGICLWSCPHQLLNMPAFENSSYTYFIDNLRMRAKRSLTLIIVSKKKASSIIGGLFENKEKINPAVLVTLDRIDHFTDFHLVASLAAGFSIAIYNDNSKIWNKDKLRNYSGLPVGIAENVDELVDLLILFNNSEGITKSSKMLPSRKISQVRMLTELYGVKNLAFDAPVIGYVNVDQDSCLLCDACSSMCPTGALALEVTENSISLRFNHAYCDACWECVWACSHEAINLKYVYNNDILDKKVTLTSDKIAKCKLCGRPIGSLKMIRHVEEILKRRGAPKWVQEQIWLCPKCKIYGLYRSIRK